MLGRKLVATSQQASESFLGSLARNYKAYNQPGLPQLISRASRKTGRA